VAKRNPYSRWRRLPPVFRSGEHKLPVPGEEPQRIIIYLPAAVLDQAELLAGKAGVPTIQEYCAGLLGRAIEVERVKAHMVEVEAKRGPMEGFNEVTGDPDYLAEWHEQSESREHAAGRPQPPNSSGVEAIPASSPLTGATGRVQHPAPAGTDLEDGNDRSNADSSPGREHRESPERVLVRIEPAPRATGPVITERIVPEVLDGTALEALLSHVGPGDHEPHGFLPSLRRGQPLSPAGVSELMAALHQIEADQHGASMLERRLSYALYRLALESQVLLTEVWPGVFDDRTIGAIRAVQEMVERILSGQDSRYYEAQDSRAAENAS
jgi:hypothetical protein